jgi:predicted transcriptional regulator
MKPDPITTAVREAITGAPCSIRALARQAGVPDSTLSRINSGQLAPSPALVSALIYALRSWGHQCEKLAQAMEKASEKGA